MATIECGKPGFSRRLQTRGTTPPPRMRSAPTLPLRREIESPVPPPSPWKQKTCSPEVQNARRGRVSGTPLHAQEHLCLGFGLSSRWLGDPMLPPRATSLPMATPPSPMACGGNSGWPEAGLGCSPFAASCHRSSPSLTFCPLSRSAVTPNMSGVWAGFCRRSSWWPTGSAVARRPAAWIYERVAGIHGGAQIEN